jgi:hypothetical protein
MDLLLGLMQQPIEKELMKISNERLFFSRDHSITKETNFSYSFKISYLEALVAYKLCKNSEDSKKILPILN